MPSSVFVLVHFRVGNVPNKCIIYVWFGDFLPGYFALLLGFEQKWRCFALQDEACDTSEIVLAKRHPAASCGATNVVHRKTYSTRRSHIYKQKGKFECRHCCITCECARVGVERILQCEKINIQQYILISHLC